MLCHREKDITLFHGEQTCSGAKESQIQSNRRLLVCCLIVTLLWGLTAHGYHFLQSAFSHDSMNNIVSSTGHRWRIALGRIFVPAYRTLARGAITIPWMIGLLSLLYIALTVFLVVKLVRIRSITEFVLISGIFTVNTAVTATAATYMHDLDCNMLALLLSAAAVYLWKCCSFGYIYGMIPLCISIGLYQSYICVSIILIMILSVLDLLDGQEGNTVFFNGLKSIGMLIGAGMLYFLSVTIVCSVTKIPLASGEYNSIDKILSMSLPQILKTFLKGYTGTIDMMVLPKSVYSNQVTYMLHIGMLGITGVLVLHRICKKEIKLVSKILVLFLLALFPLGANIVVVLTGGMSHDLMHYAVWMEYLLMLCIAYRDQSFVGRKKFDAAAKAVISALIVIVLWGNVETANTAYLKKDLEQEATLSLMTRVVYRMEEQEEYITGETPVVFVGKPNALLAPINGFDSVYELTGSQLYFVLGAAGRGYYENYFRYVLQNPIVIADDAAWNAMKTSAAVEHMPCYPNENCMAMVDGILVVKLGE